MSTDRTGAAGLTVRAFLIRGLLAGLVAGLAAFAVAYVAGEPSVAAAIAVEEAGGGHGHATGDEHAEPAGSAAAAETEVPRSLQSTVGLATATVVLGSTLGGLVGVLAGLAMGRFGRAGVRSTTLGVAGVGLVAVQLVPFWVYPPNPPAVGSADTIGLRTTSYFVLLAVSVLAAATAVLVGRWLRPRWGGWNAGLAAGAGYLLVVVVAGLRLPGFNEVPDTFPPTVLYDFRLGSLLTQLTLWVVLGLVLATLVGRLVRSATVDASAEPQRDTVPA